MILLCWVHCSIIVDPFLLAIANLFWRLSWWSVGQNSWLGSRTPAVLKRSSYDHTIELCHLCFICRIHRKQKGMWGYPHVPKMKRCMHRVLHQLRRSKTWTFLGLKENVPGKMLRKHPISQSQAQIRVHRACKDYMPARVPARPRMLNAKYVVGISLTSTQTILPVASNHSLHAL